LIIEKIALSHSNFVLHIHIHVRMLFTELAANHRADRRHIPTIIHDAADAMHSKKQFSETQLTQIY